MIAFVKDILIYLVIIVAIIYLPGQVGGWDAIFGAAEDKMAATNEATGGPTGIVHPRRRRRAGRTPPWRSARRWRSSCTRTRSPRRCRRTRRNTIRRNAAILPAYSFVLGLLALLGWVAIAAGTQPIGLDGEPNAQLVIPQLFEDMFPAWFAGVAFAAIAIGALVPAAIMSIAAANTFSRNIYKEWLKKDATPAQEAKVSKLMSLLVKAFALVFVLTLDKQNAINFQLLGGIWMLQTFPVIVFSLFTRWFHRYGLLVGWAVGMVYGTVGAYNVNNPVTGKTFGGSLDTIPGIGEMGYIAMTAFVLNVAVATVLTVGAAGGEGVQRSRRDDPVRLLRRRRRPAGAEGPRRAQLARDAVRRPGRHPGQRTGALTSSSSGGRDLRQGAALFRQRGAPSRGTRPRRNSCAHTRPGSGRHRR